MEVRKLIQRQEANVRRSEVKAASDLKWSKVGRLPERQQATFSGVNPDRLGPAGTLAGCNFLG